MLSKRIIPCLDVRDGKTTKGIKFRENVDIGDPVEMAKFYYEEGADEIVFYDITASSDRRDIMIDVVDRVAQEIFIPFSVGGGIRTIDDMRRVLLAGAEKAYKAKQWTKAETYALKCQEATQLKYGKYLGAQFKNKIKCSFPNWKIISITKITFN